MALGVAKSMRMSLGCETPARLNINRGSSVAAIDAELLRHIRNARADAAIGFWRIVAVLLQSSESLHLRLNRRPAVIKVP